MEIPLISKKLFNKFRKHLPTPGNAEKIDARVMLSCCVHIIKNGLRWRDLPEKYGNFDSIRRRFARWSKSGFFRDAFNALSKYSRKKDAAQIDSTTVKAHRTACSLASDGNPRKIGKSVGGWTTKIHLLANKKKIPLDFVLSGGEVNDARGCEPLIDRNLTRIKILLADKAYDTDHMRQKLADGKVKACIPPKCNRKNPASFDRELYKERSGIEIMFGKLKNWRGIAMRYCRSAHMFDSFVCVAMVSLFSDVR